LQEIKYIQNNPELNEYYCRMQKCFNEAFLFATIVSQGGTAIEEQSRVAKSLENISSLVSDIPFASLIVNQFKYGASEISKAKTKGQQGNFSDMVFTSDPIESSLLAERIARRFTTSRELNEQAGNQIIANASEIKDKGRIEKMKIYLKDQAEKLAKYLGVDKNLQKGFLGEELTPTNQLALSDFAKAVEFIFNEGISPEIKSNIDETDRHQEIAKEIVSKAIELEVKDFKRDYQTASDNRITQPTQKESSPIVATTSTSEIEVSIVNLGPTPEELMAKFAEIEQRLEAKDSEIATLRRRVEERENTIGEIATLRRRVEERENTIGEIQTNQEKLKKLTEIADFAPDLEITIGVGSQAKIMKLGDIMKDQKNKTSNLEQNLGDVFSQIQNRLEDLQLQIENQGEKYKQRPSRDITEIKSICCVPKLNKEGCAIT
jgi:hypothetical protein